MPSHTYVVRGDIRRLYCDAWLLPTDTDLVIERYWLDDELLDGRVDPALIAERNGAFVANLERPSGWGPGGVRVVHWAEVGVGPAVFLVHVGGGPSTPFHWFIEGARQFVASAAAHLRRDPTRRQTSPGDRRRPLLALPIIGTGRGGKVGEQAALVRELLIALSAAGEEHDVDVALVAFRETSFAAAQRARRELGDRAWSALPRALTAVGHDLARRAVAGELVLFLGAGVSKGAGLPLWGPLLGELAAGADFDEHECAALGRMDLLDQARLVELRLGHRRQLETALSRRLTTHHHALAHAQLAALPVDAVVTLNYDQLFELAARLAGSPVAVLPTPPGATRRWLLKLHGCISRPEDIVLTREDYLRYGDRRSALIGIVQALLITRHMLFVGFGLQDANFHRIVDDVRKAVGPHRSQEAATRTPFGTALFLGPEPLRQQLWGDDLDLVDVSRDAIDDDQPARTLDVLLDFVLFQSSDRPSYLLRPEFDALLSDGERRLRDDLAEVHRRHAGTLAGSAAWQRFEQLIESLGGPGRPRT